MPSVKKIVARQVLDSRGNPTIEAEVHTESGFASAIVPSGASTGSGEALELRDGGKAFHGMGVTKAVSNVNKILAPKIIGMDALGQRDIDGLMLKLDGTENKSKLGANAILSVSMAAMRAAANESKLPLYAYVGKVFGNKEFVLPVPMMVLLEGGKHADNSTDLQEFMVAPLGAKSFSEALTCGVEIYHALGKLLKSKGYSINVGHEGAYAPRLPDNGKALDFLVDAIEEAGYSPGSDVLVALDAAASEMFHNGLYDLKTEGKSLSSGEMIDYFASLAKKHPLYSLEDALAEDDWQGWQELNKRLGSKLQIVGDDLTVTNIKRIKKAVELKAANALLVKPNQIGTITETAEAVKLARSNNFRTILSHRAGESEDSFIADFAVGLSLGQCKFGAPARAERTCKYNQLLRIEEELSAKGKAEYAGKRIRR